MKIKTFFALVTSFVAMSASAMKAVDAMDENLQKDASSAYSAFLKLSVGDGDVDDSISAAEAVEKSFKNIFLNLASVKKVGYSAVKSEFEKEYPNFIEEYAASKYWTSYGFFSIHPSETGKKMKADFFEKLFKVDAKLK